MRTREAALSALLTLLTGAYAWANTPTRRLSMWDKVPKEQQPALFQFEGDAQPYRWSQYALPIREISVQLFVYVDSSDPTAVPAQQISAIMDALDAALLTKTGQKQTLGGTCDWCRIDGIVTPDPGDIDGQGLILVPIKITLP